MPKILGIDGNPVAKLIAFVCYGTGNKHYK